MIEKYARWPTLLAAFFLTTAAIGIDITNPTSSYMVVALLILASACLGAFIYAEGARHREWLGHLFGKEGEDHQDTPGALPDEKE